MELRRSGFSEAEIRARENLLRQNSTASHGHGAQGALHPRADRRRREDRRGRGRLREGNLPDRRAKRRVAAARAGPAGKARPDGRAAEPDHRAQGARSWCNRKPSSRTSRTNREKSDTEAISMAAGGGSGRGHPGSHRSKRPRRRRQGDLETRQTRSVASICLTPCRPAARLSPCLDATWSDNCQVELPLDCRRATKGFCYER